MLNEIIIRQLGPERWAWYVKEVDGHEGSTARRTIASCQEYYSRPDVAWRHAMTALEAVVMRDVTRIGVPSRIVSRKVGA
jgi:hypothetical protein